MPHYLHRVIRLSWLVLRCVMFNRHFYSSRKYFYSQTYKIRTQSLMQQFSVFCYESSSGFDMKHQQVKVDLKALPSPLPQSTQIIMTVEDLQNKGDKPSDYFAIFVNNQQFYVTSAKQRVSLIHFNTKHDGCNHTYLILRF